MSAMSVAVLVNDFKVTAVIIQAQLISGRWLKMQLSVMWWSQIVWSTMMWM